MKVAELQALATELGIAGASKLRKGELVAAINDSNEGSNEAPQTPEPELEPAAEPAP